MKRCEPVPMLGFLQRQKYRVCFSEKKFMLNKKELEYRDFYKMKDIVRFRNRLGLRYDLLQYWN